MKILRAILLALLASFVFGLGVGTWLRVQMETPERYFIGANPESSEAARPA